MTIEPSTEAPLAQAASEPAATRYGDEAARQEFCARLKRVREGTGIALVAIAAATKINESYFEALERADLSRWPKGIFRRAYFRSYVNAIGLPLESTVEEFVRFFPDDAGTFGEPAPGITADGTDPLRLTLAQSARWLRGPVRAQAGAAVIDVGVILLVAGALAWLLGADVAMVAALVALCYHAATTACIGQSPALRWAQRGMGRARRRPRRKASPAAIRQVQSRVGTMWLRIMSAGKAAAR